MFAFFFLAVKVLGYSWWMPPHHPQVIVWPVSWKSQYVRVNAAWSPPVDLQQSGYWGVRNIQIWAAGEFSESLSVSVATVSISWCVVLSTAPDVWTKQPLLCEMQVITEWRETTSETRQRQSNAVNVTLYHGTMLSRVDFNDLTWNVLCTEEE